MQRDSSNDIPNEEETKNSLLVMISETGISAIDDESFLTSIERAADSLKDINFLSSSGKLLKRIFEKTLSGKKIFIKTDQKKAPAEAGLILIFMIF